MADRELEKRVERLNAATEEWRAKQGRIAIAGGPLSGKSYLAQRLEQIGIPVSHTDILIETHKWGDDSAEVAQWMLERGPWVIEGVTVARALRKFMERFPDRKPCDLVVWTNSPVVKRSKGQEAMAKGVDTVFTGIRPVLVARNVQILEVP